MIGPSRATDCEFSRGRADGSFQHAIIRAPRAEPPTSRQIALAAKPDTLFGFHLSHLEQTHQQVELVPPRQRREVGECLGNEDCRLIRIALPARLIVWRTLVPACWCPRSPPPCLGQKIASNTVLFEKLPFLRVQLPEVFYNLRGVNSRPAAAPSTSVDLTPGASAPMFGAKRPTRISRNRPLFFP